MAWRRNCLGAAETIAVDAQPHHPEPGKTGRGASQEAEVVAYALSRSAGLALIAEYQTQLPDKTLLRAMLHEFYLQDSAAADDA